MLSKVWSDCDGGVITTELVLVASVLTATLLTGLSSFRNHIESEFQHLGQNLHQARTMGAAAMVAPRQPLQAAADELPGTMLAGDVDSFLID